MSYKLLLTQTCRRPSDCDGEDPAGLVHRLLDLVRERCVRHARALDHAAVLAGEGDDALARLHMAEQRRPLAQLLDPTSSRRRRPWM